jgi:7-cyano-7-deazaguanine synthase
MMVKDVDVLVLLSGGIDSTACLHYYLSEKFSLECIFIDYGQKSKKYELESAKKITEYYDIKLIELKIDSLKDYDEGEIVGRNSFLVISTIMNIENNYRIIGMGIHKGTPYYDCSESFLKTMNDLLHGYFNGKVMLDAPFITWDKPMIINYCYDNNIPLDSTYSCEKGVKPPCGDCLSCLDRKEINVSKKNPVKIR